MKKGLRPGCTPVHYNNCVFKTCPDEEGIKTLFYVLSQTQIENSKLALMKKGLRREDCCRRKVHMNSKLALMKKGLRHMGRSADRGYHHSKLALMKKGLRPRRLSGTLAGSRFKTCPDEEGIKTRYKKPTAWLLLDSKLALMKKGLRHRKKIPHSFLWGIQNLP